MYCKIQEAHSCRPGRCLSRMRRIVERHLLLQCGARPDLYSHYQHPLLAHLSPLLFTRNVERGPGDIGLGPGQLSLKSLWPVALMSPKTSTELQVHMAYVMYISPSAHYSPEGVEIDVRSCVLSLIDLFSHWLSHHIHSLLLLHTIRAILMLSDLFSVVRVILFGPFPLSYMDPVGFPV